jgi:hypothetical protein
MKGGLADRTPAEFMFASARARRFEMNIVHSGQKIGRSWDFAVSL